MPRLATSLGKSPRLATSLGKSRNCWTAIPRCGAAVLYRTNAQSRLFEEALRRAGRDFLLVGSVAFYQRAEVKDLLAYLKAAVSRDDAVSLRRIINVPARGIGNSTLAKLQEHAAGHNVSLWTALEQSLDGRLLPGRALAALEKFRNLMTQLRALAERETVSEVLAWVIEKTEYRDSLESDHSKDSQSRVENVDEASGRRAGSVRSRRLPGGLPRPLRAGVRHRLDRSGVADPAHDDP